MKQKLVQFKKMALKCLLGGVGILALSLQSYSQSKMFGVTPNHEGIYNSNFSEDVVLAKKWSVKTNGYIYSSGAVLDGNVYFGSDDSCFYAVEDNGNVKWKFKSNGKIRSTAAIKDTVVYFNNYGGKLYALDISTGAEVWSFTTEGESVYSVIGLRGMTPPNLLMADPWDMYQSSPVYADTIIYFGSGKNMYAINLKNGELVWKFTALDVIHSTPALHTGTVYFGCWDGKLYALDAYTGSLKWDFITNDGIASSPSVMDSLVFIGSRDANVYAINTKTGKKIWSKSFNGSWMPSSFAILNDTVYTGSSDAAKFFALNKDDGKVRYSIGFPSLAFSTPVYSNGHIFIGCVNGSLYSIDAINRKIISRFDTEGHKKDIYNVLNENGTINNSVFPPNSPDYYVGNLWYETLISIGSIFSTPVIENNLVYFGSTDSCFYAVRESDACKPKFAVSESILNLGDIAGKTTYDTVFYITGTSECEDTLLIEKTGNIALLKEITVEPLRVYTSYNNPAKIRVSIHLANLKNLEYNAEITVKTQSNEYYSKAIRLFFSNLVTSVNETQKTENVLVSPNPFTDIVNIGYTVKKMGKVEITIINSCGQLVRNLLSDNQLVGEYTLTWNGKDNAGNPLTQGVYFCTIQQENSLSTIKLLAN